MQYPISDIKANFEINRPIRYQNITKSNYLHRRTATQTSRITTIGSFIEKKPTYKTLRDKQKIILANLNPISKFVTYFLPQQY